MNSKIRGTDSFKCIGEDHVFVIHYFSNSPEIAVLTNTTVNSVVTHASIARGLTICTFRYIAWVVLVLLIHFECFLFSPF